MSHSFSNWKVQDQGAVGLMSGDGYSLLPMWYLLAMSFSGDECCVLTWQKE
jgi:hypothetical protein